MNAYRKAAVAVATALAVLAVALADGVSGQEWIAIALAALGSVGVYAVPNAATPQ